MVESPPNVLGMVDDFWFRYVCDMGSAGPDKGKGGKYFILPPGYKGAVPKGYFVFRSPTFGNVMFWRGFVVNGSTQTAVENFHKHTRIYSLAHGRHPPEMKFINTSGMAFNTIHANSFSSTKRSTRSCRKSQPKLRLGIARPACRHRHREGQIFRAG